MQTPVILKKETVLELARGTNNPRNSEGDFARLKNGDILFAYSRYRGADDHDDAACDIAGLISHDNGRSFSPLPHLLAAASEHGVQNIMSVSLQRLPNGELCLFYLCKHTPQSEMILRRADAADETRFGAPETVFPVRKGIYYVVNNCRVCVTREGRVLIPAACHKIVKRGGGEESGEYYGHCVLFEGDRNGRNWRQLPHTFWLRPRGCSGTGLQEPGVAELPDGALYAYFRTDRAFQFESVSKDGGKTWSTPMPSRFTAPESPMLLAKNPYSGTYYALWNPIPLYNGRIDPNAKWVNAGRTPFVLAASENGRDFSPCAVVEDDPACGYCYPAAFFLSETELLLSYCCGGPADGMCLTKTRITKLTLL